MPPSTSSRCLTTTTHPQVQRRHINSHARRIFESTISYDGLSPRLHSHCTFKLSSRRFVSSADRNAFAPSSPIPFSVITVTTPGIHRRCHRNTGHHTTRNKHGMSLPTRTALTAHVQYRQSLTTCRCCRNRNRTRVVDIVHCEQQVHTHTQTIAAGPRCVTTMGVHAPVTHVLEMFHSRSIGNPDTAVAIAVAPSAPMSFTVQQTTTTTTTTTTQLASRTRRHLSCPYHALASACTHTDHIALIPYPPTPTPSPSSHLLPTSKCIKHPASTSDSASRRAPLSRMWFPAQSTCTPKYTHDTVAHHNLTYTHGLIRNSDYRHPQPLLSHRTGQGTPATNTATPQSRCPPRPRSQSGCLLSHNPRTHMKACNSDSLAGSWRTAYQHIKHLQQTPGSDKSSPRRSRWANTGLSTDEIANANAFAPLAAMSLPA